MKKLTHIILRVLCVFLPHVCAAAADEVIYIGGDHTFDENQVINADIHITGSGTITNYDVLNGNIIIDSGYAVSFQNFGQITSSFELNETATIIQIVTSGYDLHKIGNLTGHTVNVNIPKGNILNMADFVNVVSGATTVDIASGEFLLDANVSYNNVPFDMHDNTVLYVNGIPDDLSRPLILGKSGNPVLHGVNIDPMYEITINEHLLPDVYVRLVRRTDYVNIRKLFG